MLTIADWTLLAAALLPIVTIGWAKSQALSEFDNANPRNPAFYQEGPRARAYAAQLNGFEALPFYLAAVLLAEFRGAPQELVNYAALGFIAARVIYVYLYITNQASARTLAWSAAWLCNLAIFLSPLSKAG